MSKRLKKAIRSFLLWITKYFLEAASFFEVEEGVEVHTAQITAGEEPAPKEEVKPPPKAKTKVKAKAKTKVKAKKRRGTIPPTQYGYFYALRLVKATLEEAHKISGLNCSTFNSKERRDPEGIVSDFTQWFEEVQVENPEDPLLNHEKVQAHYLVINGKSLQGKVSKAKRVQEINASLEFPKEQRGQKPKEDRRKRKRTSDFKLGMLLFLASKEGGLGQIQSSKWSGVNRGMLTLNDEPRKTRALKVYKEHMNNQQENIKPWKVWPRLMEVCALVSDGMDLAEACKEADGLELSVIYDYWALNVQHDGVHFRNELPVGRKRKYYS
jgi:hypothetical protein